MCPPPEMNSTLEDDRPLVKDLLEEHAKTIEKVRGKISSDPLYEAERYDDLWILRFVLSRKGSVKKSAKAALKTMKFRDESGLNRNGDYQHRIKNIGVENDPDVPCLPGYEKFNEQCGPEWAMVFYHPDPDRGLLVFGDMGNVDTDATMKNLTAEEYRHTYICSIEGQYRILDEVTRRTGRLTKLVRFVDLGSMTFHRAFLQRDGAVQSELQDYYPQLLEKQFLFNLPTWLRAMWKVITALFPKRLIEKLDVCPGDASTTFYEPIGKYVFEDQFPEKLGGKMQDWPPPSIAELHYRRENPKN